MNPKLPTFAGDGTYSSWKEATTGGRFVCSPESKSSRVLIDRHSKDMERLRKNSGLKEDSKVISWLLTLMNPEK